MPMIIRPGILYVVGLCLRFTCAFLYLFYLSVLALPGIDIMLYEKRSNDNLIGGCIMVDSIKKVLMERDEMSSKEADEAIECCRADLHDRLANGEMPHDICEEHFGLEPDYLMELL